MGCKLDDFRIDAVYKSNELNRDSFNFLEHSGRKALYSQGIYGQGVVVAVLDTGVSPHPEFENRLLAGKNCISVYGNEEWTDDNSHGTHVAGSIAGKTCGIAPKAEILPVKVLDATGGGEWKDIISGLDYARTWRSDSKKVKIISMSLSGGANDITATEKINLEEAVNKCVEANILVVCSMGNTSKDERRYPACFDKVVAVGAVDMDRKIAQFSTTGNHVDVCQIGTGVISAYYQGEYLQLSGTSMSTPIVSGIAALLACEYQNKYNKEITENELWNGIRRSTKDVGIKYVDSKYGVGFCTVQPLNLTIEVEHGSNIAYFNGQRVELPVPIQMLGNGHTVIPLRAFATATGGDTRWEAENEYHKTKAKFIW